MIVVSGFWNTTHWWYPAFTNCSWNFGSIYQPLLVVVPQGEERRPSSALITIVKHGSRLIRRPCLYHVSFFCNSYFWNLKRGICGTFEKPGCWCTCISCGRAMTPRGKLAFRYRETMISQLKVFKKTLDFLFFKAEHPDSSFMIQVLIPWPIRFIRDGPTGYIKGLNTGYITALDMWSMYRSSPFRSTLNTGYITALDMHVWSMYRSSPFRSTLNTGYITALDMCEVCTEAVHSVTPWTRVTSQLWTCVKFVPKHPFRSTLNTGYITALDMCEVCTKAVHSVAPWTRVTSQLWTCVKYVPKQSIP